MEAILIKLTLNPFYQKRTVPDFLPLSGTKQVQYDQPQGRNKTTKPKPGWQLIMLPLCHTLTHLLHQVYSATSHRVELTPQSRSMSVNMPYVNPAAALRYLPLWETDIPKIEILKFFW